MAAELNDLNTCTVCEPEMLGLDESVLSPGRPLRIALNAIVDCAPKFGSRVYLWELASALANTDGVILSLLVGEGQVKDVPAPLRSCACEVPVSARKSYLQVFQGKQIQKALRREQADVYLLPNTIPLLSKSTPTVITIHDLTEVRIRKYGILRTAYRFLVNLVAAHLADRVVTVSENSKRDIVRLLRVPESKVTVVYNGVSGEFRRLDRKDCQEYIAGKYSIAGDFILAPGGLSKNKNIPNLLASMRTLREMGSETPLVVLGDINDPEFKYVSVIAEQALRDGTVVFPGFVPRADLPAFYNAASVVAYPTLYEGFGLPVLEAMACGTPVVTSNNSSLPEIAGGVALLVNPMNPDEIAVAVHRLLTDGTLRADLSSRGLRHARQFTWRRAAEKTLEVFQEVAAGE